MSFQKIKFPFYLVSILFISFGVFWSCSSSKKTAKTRPITKIDTIAIQDSTAITIDSSEIPIKNYIKPHYNVALMLPFFLDSINTYDSTEAPETYVYRKSKLALSFYEGVQMALGNLKDSLKLNIKIFDTEKSVKETKRILTDHFFDSVDVIIGPIYNDNLRVVAEFAKTDSVPLISPLSPSTSITLSNPYYIMAEPSIEKHCKNLYTYLYDYFPFKQFTVIYQDNFVDRSLANEFYSFIDSDSIKYNMKDSLIHEFISDTKSQLDTFILDSIISKEFENIIIISSYDEAFVNHIINQLNRYSDSARITIAGLPTWKDFTSFRVDHIHKMNLHVTTPFWIDKKDKNVQKFIYNYKKTYFSEPDDHAYYGYDIMFYFGNILKKYGTGFLNHFDEYKKNALHTQYIILPTMSHQVNMKDTLSNAIPPYQNFFENNYVHIIKFEDYSWRLVKR